jgi:hypothetical protein
MKKCYKSENLIKKLQAGEISDQDYQFLMNHIRSCSHCHKLYQAHAALQSVKSTVPMPDEIQFNRMRQNVLQAVRMKKEKHFALKLPDLFENLQLFFMQYKYAVIVVLGVSIFFLGRFSKTIIPEKKNNLLLQNLLAAVHPVQSKNFAIDPFMLGVKKLKFNAQDGTVEIYYNTIQDIQLKSDLSSPAVKSILYYALSEGESPNIKLDALKTLQLITEETHELDLEYITALRELIRKEKNPGIKLSALKVLKSAALTDEIREIFFQTALYDSSQAVRIKAFNILKAGETPLDELKSFLFLAKEDTSSYIRYQASELLKKVNITNKNINLKREVSL